ncbi:LamG-like jellyroll fold domain-containing protein [Streptomyces sp. NPDC127100]
MQIFEADGVTPWRPDDTPDTLLDGTVTVDSTRAERRSFDLTIDNSSGLYTRDPNKGFWYDKVIKLRRGVEYEATPRYSDFVQAQRPALYYRLDASTTALDLSSYGVHATRHGWPVTVQPLTRSPDAIGSVRFADDGTFMSSGPLPSNHPAVTSGIFTMEAWVRPIGYGGPWGGVVFGRDGMDVRIQIAADRKLQALIRDANGDLVVCTTSWQAVAGSIYHLAATSDGAYLRLYVNGHLEDTKTWSGLYVSSTSGFSLGGDASSPNFQARADIDEVAYYGRVLSENELAQHYTLGRGREKVTLKWDTQIGEFLIDKIDEGRFPRQTKVTGRDFAKKCLTAKLPVAMTFDKDTPIETLIRSMAANAGIRKFLLPTTGVVVGEGADFDQGTERWNVMSKICETSAYELFFNADGYLVMRKQLDPTTSPISLTLQTGQLGNLVDWSKSTTDTEVYNRVICMSESSDSTVLPFYGEASNTDATSPTSIQRLGERTWIYTSSFFTSNAQCAETAQQFLSVKGLESYEVSFEHLVFPWLEAGEILEFLDPDAAAYDPTRFLLSTFSIPLKLGSMSSSAKRIIIVSDLAGVTLAEAVEEAAST